MLRAPGITARIKGRFNRLLGRKGLEDSDDYHVLRDGEVIASDGWKIQSVVERQHQAFQRLLQQARRGNPRIDFVVAAKAIEASGLADPLLVEVGCGSGYYSEVLPLLLQRPLRYIGIDFSLAMVALAQTTYGAIPFLAADACRLPLQDASCDILLNGTSLMHIANYRQAIAEGVRVSREWCIFHTVPLIVKRKTTLMHKLAYGQRVVEVIFNQAELESILGENNLAIQQVIGSIPYDVSAVLGEPSWTATYICRKI